MTKKAVTRNLKYLQLVIEGPGSASLASLIAACFSSAVMWGVIAIFPTRVPSSRWSRCRAVFLSSDISISLNLLSLIVNVGYTRGLWCGDKGHLYFRTETARGYSRAICYFVIPLRNPICPEPESMCPTRNPAHNHH